MKKYTLVQFLQEFATDKQCLAYLKAQRWPEGVTCKTCDKVTGHHLIESHKCYSCQECGTQTYPTAGTILHGRADMDPRVQQTPGAMVLSHLNVRDAALH